MQRSSCDEPKERPMQLTVLGCRSGMPADGQASSGYLVTTAGSTVLLDCGPGVATALSAVAAPGELTAVVISHLHADHCYDLLPLGKSLLHTRAARLLAERGGDPVAALRDIGTDGPRVPLHVPQGAKAVFDRLAALFPVSTAPVLDRAFDIAFDVREYRPHDRFALPDAEVSLHPLHHAAPACGTRIDTGRATLAYTGDTGPTDGLDSLARDADLLLAEATLDTPDRSGHGHLSAADAGRVAARNGVRELVLTHFPSSDPDLLAARQAAAEEHFAGPVRIAAPTARFDVSTAR
jgi:ribonuclease BN (tRNA processing enzyme)